MKRLQVALSFLALLAAWGSDSAAEQELQWRTDADAALELAERDNRPILAVFS